MSTKKCFLTNLQLASIHNLSLYQNPHSI